MDDIIELVRKIGNEVCEGCSGETEEETECGEDPTECFRLINAVDHLRDFIDKGFGG